MLRKPAIRLENPSEKNVGQIRRINSACLPVVYSESFYRHITENPYPGMSKIALCDELVVGAIVTRLEPLETDASLKRLYIMSVAVLAPYRRLGIGALLLQHILQYAEQRTDVTEIYLHVQTSNEAALDFYKRFNFQVRDIQRGYYKRIEPPDAYILFRVPSHKQSSADAAAQSV